MLSLVTGLCAFAPLPARATYPTRHAPAKMIGNFFSKMQSNLKRLQEVDYASLEGLPKSFGLEAGEWALKGEVPVRSKDGLDVATFAGGCFWGTELHFQRLPGVVATCVGYTQGEVEKPTYGEVCSGATGHTEAIQMVYDAKAVSYEDLVRKLLSTVDPTLRNRVGNDRGTQYRHGIYPHTDAQEEVAERVLRETQEQCGEKKVVTELRRAVVFWPAEATHQRYLDRGGQSAAKDAPERVRCYG